MATLVRPELSEKNRYWIDKHRYYELKHFCLQYPFWKEAYRTYEDARISLSTFEQVRSSNVPSDPTARHAVSKAQYGERIEMIEEAAKQADVNLHTYILKAITEGLSYTYMKNRMNIPCGKDMYYDRYRRFFWILDQIRE